MRIFLDTCFFIALSDERDKNHTKAKTSFVEHLKTGARFVTGRNILIEYLDGVTKRISKEKAIEELDNILNSKLLVVEPFKEEDWGRSIVFFIKYNDQQIDMTDCLSFAIMERLGLKNVLTFDNDFRIHGYVIQI
ncbi:MAG: PIN domain-containing protein [Candidatus Methanoperedens sp.]|nr:PIN domain-containing protein [Candidatus Methanoperedens sp.]